MKSMLFVFVTSITVLYHNLPVHAFEDVPENILSAFEQQYPQADDVTWEYDQGNYVASFSEDDYDKQASYGQDGAWIETVTDLDDSDIPEAINRALFENYPESEFIDFVSLIENEQGARYHLGIESDGKDIKLVFDSKGNLLKP